MNTTRFLFILALLSSWIPARAANPTFESFDPLYFKTNGAAPHRIKGFFNPTQFITNSTNGITIPDSAVIGLQYWTNVSGKLFPVTGGTNRFFIGGGSTSTGTGTNYFGDDGAFHAFTFTSDTNALWAQIGGVYYPNQVETTILLTNAVVSQALAVDGAFVEQGFSGVTANAGTNNLNPFQVGTFIVNSTTNDPAACIIDLSAGSGTGQMLAIEKGSSGAFTLKNAGLRWDDPSASNILRYVDWVPTYAGETILLHQNQQGNWVEWGRSPQATNAIGTNVVAGDIFATNLYVTNINGTAASNIIAGSSIWTNRSGTVGLVNQALPVDLQAPLIWGPGNTNYLYHQGDNLIYTNNALTSDVGGLIVATGDGSQGKLTASGNEGQLRGTAGAGLFDQLTLGREVRWFNNAFFPVQGGTILGGPPSIVGSFPWDSIYLTNQIVWGPGTTNVLYRGTNDLIYTNGYATPAIVVVNGAGTSARLSADSGSGGRAMLIGKGLPAAGLGVDGNLDAVLFQQHYFIPNQDNTTDLSGPGSSTWFRNSGVKGTNFIAALSAGTNYSWLAVYHTGTNGAQGIVFDSQAGGQAGTPKSMTFTNAGTYNFWGTAINLNGSPISGGSVTYAAVTNALSLTGSTTTFLRSDGTQAAPPGGSGIAFSTGTGSPEGAVTGSPGDMYYDTNTDFHYQKITGSATTTGWGIY